MAKLQREAFVPLAQSPPQAQNVHLNFIALFWWMASDTVGFAVNVPLLAREIGLPCAA